MYCDCQFRKTRATSGKKFGIIPPAVLYMIHQPVCPETTGQWGCHNIYPETFVLHLKLKC